jgi:Protein of unknown function, DUF488
MIYTSSFDFYRKARGVGDCGISIARRQPKWAAGDFLSYPQLAPVEYFRKCEDIELAWRVFAAAYRERVLTRLDAQAALFVLKSMARVAGMARVPVLLCWEADGSRCHRSLVANWLTEHTGERVVELTRSAGL